MSHVIPITAWADQHAFESECTSHAYTEVLRNLPDGQLCRGLAALLTRTRPDETPSREAASMSLFRFLKDTSSSDNVRPTIPGRALHFRGMFDCPCYDAAYSKPEQAGQSSDGVLRNINRTHASPILRNHS